MIDTDTRPIIVCLCGSTRFSQAFRDANLRETLAGKIVLSIGCDMRSDDDVFAAMSDDERAATKSKLDALHLRKVELADEVLILNVGGYVGDSTRRELAHARMLGKRVAFLEPLPPIAISVDAIVIDKSPAEWNVMDEVRRYGGFGPDDGAAPAPAMRVRR